jgi:hypothetical protein
MIKQQLLKIFSYSAGGLQSFIKFSAQFLGEKTLPHQYGE